MKNTKEVFNFLICSKLIKFNIKEFKKTYIEDLLQLNRYILNKTKK